MLPQIRDLIGFMRFVAQRLREDRCTQVAASLTYTTLLGLVPMITIALTLMSAFPVFERFMVEVRHFILANLVPDVAGKVITHYMEQFSQNAAGLTALGIALIAVTALLLMFTIENAFNAIFRTRRSRPLPHRFLIYWATLTLGPILVGASISVTSYLVGLSKGWVRAIPVASELLLKIVPLGLTTIAFSLLYLTVPNRFVSKLHALMGGLIAAVVFEVMKRVFAAYVASVPTYSLVYGAFASFPIFLLWLYCSWLVILLGAVITASLPYWQGGVWRIKATPRQRFQDALRLLRLLYEAHAKGQTVSQASLRLSLPIAPENLESLLERLTVAGLVRRVSGNGYGLVRRPDEIRLADIYRLFVLEADAAGEGAATDADLALLMTKISEDVEQSLGLTLESAFARPRAEEQA